MKNFILLGFVFSVIFISNFNNVLAAGLLFPPSEVCQYGAWQGTPKCNYLPTAAECISVGGTGNIIDEPEGIWGCVGSCNEAELQYGKVYSCETPAPTCPANPANGTWTAGDPNTMYTIQGCMLTCTSPYVMSGSGASATCIAESKTMTNISMKYRKVFTLSCPKYDMSNPNAVDTRVYTTQVIGQTDQ